MFDEVQYRLKFFARVLVCIKLKRQYIRKHHHLLPRERRMRRRHRVRTARADSQPQRAVERAPPAYGRVEV